MAGLGKGLMIGGAVLAVLAAGGGGTFAALKFLPHHNAGTQKTANSTPPRQIYFADLPAIVVSIPPQAGQPATSYVQIDMQFSTYDPAAVNYFATYQPIIKAQIINLLMSETSDQLQVPTIRVGLIRSCLGISNDVLQQNGAAGATPPFNAAYITNLVIQD